MNYVKDEKTNEILTKLTKNQKIAIVCSAVTLAIIIVVLCIYGCGKGGFGKEHNNVMALAKMYVDKGEYERALDKIEELLEKNIADKDALDLMDEILAVKGKGENGAVSNVSSNVNVQVDTSDLTEVIESMKSGIEKNNLAAEKNSQAMADLLEQQKSQAQMEKIRQEEQKKQQKLAEEQRKKEETEKKAEEARKLAREEELKKKNAQLAKEIAQVNDELQQGNTALNSGNILVALQHFEKADGYLPVSAGEPAFSAEKRSEIAQILQKASKTADSPENTQKLKDAALKYAKETIKLNENDAPANTIIGEDAMANKNYEDALANFQKAVQTDSKNYLYYYNLGRAQYMLKKFTEAKYSFTTSCSLNGSFAPARYNLGLTNNRLNDAKSALLDFRKAHDIDPLHEKAFLEEGRVLSNMQDWNGAVYAYNKAVTLNSTNRQAFQELGNAYTQLKNYEGAENAFKKSLALLPSGQNDPSTYYNLSTILLDQNKIYDAVNYAKKAYDSASILKENASKINVIYNYALMLEKSGKMDDAIVKYSEVMKLNPNHLKTQINLGVIYMTSNPPDYDMALSLFLKAYNQDNASFEANNNLGSAYLYKKDYKNAILYFQNALRLNSSDNEVRTNLAGAFAGDAQYDNAKTTYLEVLRQDGESWDSYIELAKVCTALNDNEGAEKYLEYIKAKNPSFKKNEVENLLKDIRG